MGPLKTRREDVFDFKDISFVAAGGSRRWDVFKKLQLMTARQFPDVLYKNVDCLASTISLELCTSLFFLT